MTLPVGGQRGGGRGTDSAAHTSLADVEKVTGNFCSTIQGYERLRTGVVSWMEVRPPSFPDPPLPLPICNACRPPPPQECSMGMNFFCCDAKMVKKWSKMGWSAQNFAVKKPMQLFF